MATNWSFILAASAIGSSATGAATTATTKPNPGDLMVLTSRNLTTITKNNTGTVTDTGSGGWRSITLNNAPGASLAVQGMWWKVATKADFNNGSGITVTVTWTGTTGTSSATEVECDIFRLPNIGALISNTASTQDSFGTASQSATGTTLTATGISGPTLTPIPTDCLAVTSLCMGTAASNGGISAVAGSNQYTGASAAAALANCVTTANTLLANQFVGGVTPSSVFASNIWKNTWITSRTFPSMIGACFEYRVGGGILPILGSV